MSGKRKGVPPRATSADKPTKWVDTRGIPAGDKKAQKRTPPDVQVPVAIDHLPFQWTGDNVDHEFSGEWDWNLAPKEAADVLKLLGDMCDLTWGQIKAQTTSSKKRVRAKHHSQPVESLAKDARDRLHNLGRGDQESLFRLRHGNMIRVWGVLEGPIFRILWYDRNHRVCPTE